SAAQEHIARNWPLDTGHEPSLPVEVDECPAFFATAPNEGRSGHDITETHNCAQMVERYLELRAPVHLYPHRIVVEVEVRGIGGDVQRVEKLLHSQEM